MAWWPKLKRELDQCRTANACKRQVKADTTRRQANEHEVTDQGTPTKMIKTGVRSDEGTIR